MEQLKPCPLCENPCKVIETQRKYNFMSAVECTVCGYSVSVLPNMDLHDNWSREMVVEIHNDRPQPVEESRLRARVAELTRCLKAMAPSACCRCEACKDRAICSLDPSVPIVHALGHCQIADGCPIVKVLTPDPGGEA